MFIFKFLVLYKFVCFNVCACWNVYCDINVEHTLCKFPVEGRSSQCVGYESSHLIKDEINAILHKINLRRQQVAMGLARGLPQAANMNSVIWSETLARSAQRWADQCDPSVHPNKEDQCRDLVDMKVGQNIATILGYSSGVHVTSLVETWYMQILDFAGPVSYYNQSLSNKSKYFTQLIWAETAAVGCGRSIFMIGNQNAMRLVCNFAPRGNVLGKPVYVIGLPATQCSRSPHRNYTGLCQSDIHVNDDKNRRYYYRNLMGKFGSNETVINQEIDPVNASIRRSEPNLSYVLGQRFQKMRHAYVNNSFVKSLPEVRTPVVAPTTQERKFHSHVLHNQYSQRHVNGLVLNYPQGESNPSSYGHQANNGPIKRYELITPLLIPLFNAQNFQRRYDPDYCCTRRTTQKDDGVTSHCIQCTRSIKPNDCLHQENAHNCETNCQTTVSYPICPTTQCICYSVASKPCPEFHRVRKEGFTEYYSTTKSDYYDFYPKLSLRNSYSTETPTTTVSTKNWFLKEKQSKGEKKRTLEPYSKNVDNIDYSKYYTKAPTNFHGYLLHSIGRKQRNTEETFKPFWQDDYFSLNKRPELKSMRYTTLYQRKNRKTTQPTPINLLLTEPITIAQRQMSLEKQPFTSRYLSFDELLRLRNFNKGEFSGRRAEANKTDPTNQTTPETNTTTATTTTTAMTTNTPFIRMKACTRKLTCTWTIPGRDRDKNGQGGGGGGGSRTPPGYVEGCTRTSTCTRDFFERNKQPGLDSSGGNETEADEDYCEKRSLDNNRRMLVKKITELTEEPMEPFWTVTPSLRINFDVEEKRKTEDQGCICGT